MWIVRALLVIILIIVLVGFSVKNASERVWIKIVDTPKETLLIYVVYWAFVFGMLISFILFATVYLRQANEIRRFRRQAEALQSEISALRNRTIDETAEKFLQPEKDEGK